MKKKINQRLMEITILAIVMTTICMTFVYYGIYQNQVKKDLQMMGKTLSSTKSFYQELQNQPSSLKLGINNLRITWIDADGTVLYDNDIDIGDMENHSDRPEVQEALASGEGEIVRNSHTMNQKNFYYALLQSDGTVLRVATGARSILNVFMNSFPMIIMVLFVVVLICTVLAHFLTKQLLLPIKNVVENLDDTTQIPEYKELVPLVHTIRSQHENILMSAKVRQDFTANVSHELKTPLTAISGYAEMIENKMVDENQTIHFSQEIKRNSNRLLVLIDDIIRLSEIDNGESNFVTKEVDLDRIARVCMKELKVQADKRDVTITYHGSKCVLMANPTMMRELIQNLCENAIRYNNSGGYVEVTIKEEQGQGLLIVKDNGIGIPKDQQERVFERFYRVDKSRSKRTGGTGLGLAIVKHIVELHDAKLSLISELGKGTEIRIEF
ncbi:Phosphate regulon sensor protein PhoR (SphS) [Lachnospiraceae bacterium TWA4]|nr:Phosphate regulon sensor protein PhoR (SphS) [Lachnospiraceae bacterium TWA4]